MIQINLLEQTSGRRKGGSKAAAAPRPAGGSRGSGAALVTLAVLAMLALNGAVGWMVYQRWDSSYQAYTTLKTQRDKVKDEVAKKLNDAEQIRKYREVVNNQMDVLKTLDPPDRLLWSEKFNMLASLMPANVFLSGIEVSESVTEVETQASAAARQKWEKGNVKTRGTQPAVVKKPVISYTMRITGLGLGKDNVEQFNNALNFNHAMIAYQTVDAQGKTQHFMDGFNPNIDFELLEATTYEGEPVNKFIFKLTTVPVGDNEAVRNPKDAAVKKTPVVASATQR